MKRTAIYWFRNDLRTTDNPSLAKALEENDLLITVFVYDDRWWESDVWGFRKTGARRTQFLMESVEDLKASLADLGATLQVYKGCTEQVLVELAERYGARAIYAQAEHSAEEMELEEEVRSIGALVLTEGLTLIHPDDLPMSLEQLPDVFTRFRNKVEKHAVPRTLVDEPKYIPTPKLEPLVEITLSDFGYDHPVRDERAAITFKGGALEAWERLDHYFWNTRQLSSYKETRNGLIGADYSSKFSAWLANGCISPREIYAEVKAYEAKHGANESTYWLIFELLWRDYFRFVAMKYGERIFFRTGIKGSAPSWRQDRRVFEAWCEGRTKDAFVNANMKELVATGFMSNRGRQNVASYLVHDLGMDWRMGAAFFEHHLVDYDPASNYGNWIYIAGVGNDPRPQRKFNTESQAERYDADGRYRRLWSE